MSTNAPDEPDAYKHINSAAIAAWRIVRAAIAASEGGTNT